MLGARSASSKFLVDITGVMAESSPVERLHELWVNASDRRKRINQDKPCRGGRSAPLPDVMPRVNDNAASHELTVSLESMALQVACELPDGGPEPFGSSIGTPLGFPDVGAKSEKSGGMTGESSVGALAEG